MRTRVLAQGKMMPNARTAPSFSMRKRCDPAKTASNELRKSSVPGPCPPRA